MSAMLGLRHRVCTMATAGWITHATRSASSAATKWELPCVLWPINVKIPVQWGDQDAYHHVNNTTYYRWFETAHIQYLQRLGIMERGNANDKNGAIIAHSECDFIFPVSYPGDVIVSCRGTAVGRSSLQVEYRAQTGDTLCATGKGTLVYYDHTQLKSLPFTQQHRQIIAEIEGLATEHEPN
eukprot:TRINITY_DN13744_c0_g1_i1.p1 TRINITY_DN13744_c0_g1~~TRINITY_DN13744_c0_g1_i1.p1  ORF type:complete len:182 (+),score=17.68 TRINITY_DN13744_c0_g1_i1:213-758(+)